MMKSIYSPPVSARTKNNHNSLPDSLLHLTRTVLLLPLLMLVTLLFNNQVRAQKNTTWLLELFKLKGNSLLQNILSQPDSFQYQIIYTQINRDKKNQPHCTNFFVNVDRSRYFNPASTVKLPTVLAALEKIHTLGNKVDANTPMLTDSAYSGQTRVWSDTSSASGLPSVNQYVKKIFLVSDNDAYNRLYELVGQQSLNEMLWQKGYPDVRITRRFVPMSEEENRHTNPIRFIRNGSLVYEQPAASSKIIFDFSRPCMVGRAHHDRNDSLIFSPMDFTKHNNLPLEDLQLLLQSVIFPASVPASKRFRLTQEDYTLLYHYMQAYPSESVHPSYDTTAYFDSYTKFFYKAGKQKIPPGIRIYNKPGWSYGFLTDAAYVNDTHNGIEFMLSAVIYVNADGVVNDDKYEYDEIGYPFFNEIYRIIYEFEKRRKEQSFHTGKRFSK